MRRFGLVTETPGVPGVFAGWAALGTLVVVATVLQVLTAFPLQASVTKRKLGHELRTAPAALRQRADGVTVPTLRPACATCWQQGWRSAAGANPQSDWRAMRRTVPLHWGRSWKRPSIGVPSPASRATARTQRTKAALFLLPLEPSNAAQGQASSIAARTPRMSAADAQPRRAWSTPYWRGNGRCFTLWASESMTMGTPACTALRTCSSFRSRRSG